MVPAPVLTMVQTPGLALECPISFDSMLDVGCSMLDVPLFF